MKFRRSQIDGLKRVANKLLFAGFFIIISFVFIAFKIIAGSSSRDLRGETTISVK